ncbi:lysozyme [Limimaricola cinnabarinus]|uniref:Lysozyme n=1 Tax=Limimaricola cinnabarinus LL-001 TaxID=1337093 RepID=U2Z361_9RHOB|nr:lysozyme [Limimaricola cinnabarinus]GAD55502.1 phage-related lysozyme [Limimaricola cinnabarinus LL-001]
MKISDRGLLEICEHEGIVPAPYYDSVGVLTYGIGHTKNAGGIDPADLPRGMPADLDAAIDHAIEVFRADIASYEARVNEAIKVPLAQHQFDALGSFDLNTGGIYRAILTRQINASDPKASEHFFGWLRPPEIRKRRTAEKRLYETGDYDHNGDEVAVWRVDERGKLRGVLKTISGAELLDRMKRPAALAPAPTPTTTEAELVAQIRALIAAHDAQKGA